MVPVTGKWLGYLFKFSRGIKSSKRLVPQGGAGEEAELRILKGTREI